MYDTYGPDANWEDCRTYMVFPCWLSHVGAGLTATAPPFTSKGLVGHTSVVASVSARYEAASPAAGFNSLETVHANGLPLSRTNLDIALSDVGNMVAEGRPGQVRTSL